MADEQHTHLFRVPEPLEKLFGELDQLERIAGPEAAGEARRAQSLVQEALAAQARGDTSEAVRCITGAMQAIAALATRVDPAEGGAMSAVAEQFGRALLRGDAGEAKNAAEEMRARSGSRVVKRD